MDEGAPESLLVEACTIGLQGDVCNKLGDRAQAAGRKRDSLAWYEKGCKGNAVDQTRCKQP